MARLVAVLFVVALLSIGVDTTATAAPTPTVFAELSRPGPYSVASTTSVKPCVGPAADAQNADARRQGARTRLLCTSAAPIGTGPDTGVDFYYPRSAPGKRPLVILMPGNRANPGYFAPVARQWASYGFIVAISYKADELLPDSGFLGLRRAVAENSDRRSAVFHRIDLRSVIVAGHSSGATKAIEMAGLSGAARLGVPMPRTLAVPPAIRIIGALAIAPDPYTVPTPVAVPTLIVTGTADRASRPSVVEPVVFGPLTGGPAWFAVARGAPHLSVVDPPTSYPLTGVSVQFLRYLTGNAGACRTFAGPGWTLGTDPTFTHVVRNAPARSADCAAFT